MRSSGSWPVDNRPVAWRPPNAAEGACGRGLFNGSHLVASQDVVVVTLDYRLNAFGFLGSAHLRDEDGSTGNFGM